MPEKETIQKAHEDAREGKSPSTQAGEFVREEIHHVREGKHGARSAKQAIAIGLSKARRAGVALPAPSASRTSPATRRKAKLDAQQAKHPHPPARKRSRAVEGALEKEGQAAGSPQALARQARSSAHQRSRKQRVTAAKKAAKTRASRARRHR